MSYIFEYALIKSYPTMVNQHVRQVFWPVMATHGASRGTSWNMAMVPLTLLPLVILASAARPSLAPPTAAEARLRPPRGYNPCNGVNCDMSSLGEDVLRSLAASIASNGMRDANYSWFNLDDGIVASRDASGTMVADKRGFPSQTLLPLATYVNGLGLALGAYTDRGTSTCEGRPGSKGHEAHDAATWVSWGVRYLKRQLPQLT